nr:hypothetical protein [Actinomyces ruminis]
MAWFSPLVVVAWRQLWRGAVSLVVRVVLALSPCVAGRGAAVGVGGAPAFLEPVFSGFGEVEVGVGGAVEVVADLGQADAGVGVGQLLGCHVLGEVVAIRVDDDVQGISGVVGALEGGFKVLRGVQAGVEQGQGELAVVGGSRSTLDLLGLVACLVGVVGAEGLTQVDADGQH